MSEVVLVSNRLPWTVALDEGRAVLKPSAGGLATALAGTHARGESLWVGWPGQLSGLPEVEREAVLATLRSQRFIPLDLDARQVERYYDGFSNGVLWPLFHYLIDKVQLEADLDWEAYEAVNQRFAEAVAEAAEPGAKVWVHDFQLMLVPRMLRDLRPDLRIGFFLHIPFPAHEVFRILPRAETLLQGLLGADLVGFHTEGYRNHFADCADRMLGAGLGEAGLHYQGRSIRLEAYGIGIDAEAFSETARQEGVLQAVEALRRDLGGRRLLLGIDRLDYTKGIPRRLLAFERLLERHPAMKDQVLLLQVGVPSRQGVEAYTQFRKQVDDIAGRINGRFGSPSHVPVHLLYQAIPFEELITLYRAADLMLVTPLRDGMNLVAKEFCAARNDESGVLILSEFAGAAADLKEALLVNPYDIGSVAETIHHALELSDRETRLRMRLLRRRVFRGNVHRWAQAFLEDLERVVRPEPQRPDQALLERILLEAERMERLVLMLDYDGTLVPFAATPQEAIPDGPLLSLLERLAEAPRLEVHLVSGRSRETLEAWFGALPITLHAEHGFWFKAQGSLEWQALSPLQSAWKHDVLSMVESWCAAHPGSSIEAKSSAVVWHFRQVPGGVPERQLRKLREQAADLVERHGLELMDGAMILEFRNRGIHKGLAVSPSMEAEGVLVVALGDDRTDEDLFRKLPLSGLAIRVGQGPSEAGHRLPDYASVRALLEGLCQAFASPIPA